MCQRNTDGDSVSVLDSEKLWTLILSGLSSEDSLEEKRAKKLLEVCINYCSAKQLR